MSLTTNQPRFPIYIVSKGRWKPRQTSKTLERMNVPYHIIVEAQEYDAYCSVIAPEKVLILDKQFQADYDTCDDLGDSKSKGAGAARNFAWHHAESLGFSHHWVMDDNIRDFYRLNQNIKARCYDGTCFYVMEEFLLRYDNLAMAGPNYEMFVPRKSKVPPIILNTRIYSCNLIQNDLPFRWRGRYNEDTDLSLRILKSGLCTVQFNAFLQDKMATQSLKGGNTKEFYEHEGTLNKSLMQVKLHPDVSRLTTKWGRPHHEVDYRPFKKNRLKLRDGLSLEGKINDFGMQLFTVNEETHGEKPAGA